MKFTEPKTLFLLPSFACVSKTPAAAIPASPHKLWCPQNQSSRKSGGQSPEHSRLRSQEGGQLYVTHPTQCSSNWASPRIASSKTFNHGRPFPDSWLQQNFLTFVYRISLCVSKAFYVLLVGSSAYVSFSTMTMGFFFSTCYILCILKLCVCINFVMSEGL